MVFTTKVENQLCQSWYNISHNYFSLEILFKFHLIEREATVPLPISSGCKETSFDGEQKLPRLPVCSSKGEIRSTFCYPTYVLAHTGCVVVQHTDLDSFETASFVCLYISCLKSPLKL